MLHLDRPPAQSLKVPDHYETNRLGHPEPPSLADPAGSLVDRCSLGQRWLRLSDLVVISHDQVAGSRYRPPTIGRRCIFDIVFALKFYKKISENSLM